MESLDEASSHWLWPGAVLDIIAIWIHLDSLVNCSEPLDGRFLCLSCLLFITVPFKQNFLNPLKNKLPQNYKKKKTPKTQNTNAYLTNGVTQF